MTRNIQLVAIAASIAINASVAAAAYAALKPADRKPSIATGQYVQTFNGERFTCTVSGKKVVCS